MKDIKLSDRKKPIRDRLNKNVYHWHGMRIKRSVDNPEKWTIWFNFRDVYKDGIDTLKQAMKIIEARHKRPELKLIQGGDHNDFY